jgi:hypothetical protein
LAKVLGFTTAVAVINDAVYLEVINDLADIVYPEIQIAINEIGTVSASHTVKIMAVIDDGPRIRIG